jgi:hypothetical protein
MFFNFKKNNLDSERIYSIRPNNLSKDFTYLLHLLSDDDILLTFNERDELYEHINFIINFLEEKKEQQKNEENDFRC